MNSQLKYVPVFRGRQQELLVLKGFNFGKRIYPCLEIIKEIDRQSIKSIKEKKPSKINPILKIQKTFENVYLPLIEKIKAEKVFIDLPIHLKESGNMKVETLNFLRTVVAIRERRTEYLKKLAFLSEKIIPVISTYYNRTNEPNSIKLQADELRPIFPNLAFRTFFSTFFNDITQIESLAQAGDYIIMDWENMKLDENDEDQTDILDKLTSLKCTIISHRNAITSEITNAGLKHNEEIENIDNSLLDKYRNFSSFCFSDYAGIKKDAIEKGGSISPGFALYDAVENKFFGFKGEYNKPETYETIIVPSILSSGAVQRMRNASLDYLGSRNIGWEIIKNIEAGERNGGESGKSPSKFKRIGMEHYLHCLKIKIENGDFDQ